MIVVMLALLLAAASIVPRRSSLSEYELRRRLDVKQKGALLQWRRGELYAELMAMRRVIVAFLLVLVSALMIFEFGWGAGLVLAFLLTVFYNRLASLPPFRGVVQRWYEARESSLLAWIDKNRQLIRPLRGVAERPMERRLGSREELDYIIDQAGTYFDETERAMLHGAVAFQSKHVGECMVVRSQVEAIGAHELLGPLVLDGLYQTGHKQFPVFEGDLDHVVGILQIHSLFAIQPKASQTAQAAMTPHVVYVREDDTLEMALAACIRYQQQLLVVIDEAAQTVGIITLRDIVAQLRGGAALPAIEDHDNPRVVAERGVQK